MLFVPETGCKFLVIVTILVMTMAVGMRLDRIVVIVVAIWPCQILRKSIIKFTSILKLVVMQGHGLVCIGMKTKSLSPQVASVFLTQTGTRENQVDVTAVTMKIASR